MSKRSAGILMYRKRRGILQFLLVHPGGPYWARKDDGAWSIPKGEYAEGEDPLQTARREFQEETGSTVEAELIPLAPIRQRSGKVVTAWGAEGDLDESNIQSNLFTIEWPPRSGKMEQYPEVDRAAWFTFGEARKKILPAQVPLLSELVEKLGHPASWVASPKQGSLF